MSIPLLKCTINLTLKQQTNCWSYKLEPIKRQYTKALKFPKAMPWIIWSSSPSSLIRKRIRLWASKSGFPGKIGVKTLSDHVLFPALFEGQVQASSIALTHAQLSFNYFSLDGACNAIFPPSLKRKKIEKISRETWIVWARKTSLHHQLEKKGNFRGLFL